VKCILNGRTSYFECNVTALNASEIQPGLAQTIDMRGLSLRIQNAHPNRRQILAAVQHHG
jgi:hypothetical protein